MAGSPYREYVPRSEINPRRRHQNRPAIRRVVASLMASTLFFAVLATVTPSTASAAVGIRRSSPAMSWSVRATDSPTW